MEPAFFAFAAVAVFVGAFVRGYSGFGSGMIWVGGLSLILPPVVGVPAVYLLDVTASAHLLPRVWRDIDWRSLRWVLAGAIISAPAGIYLLSNLPDAPLRIAIALTVLGATVLIWKGFKRDRPPGPGSSSLAGLLGGLLGAGMGMGGPPVILLYFSSPLAVRVNRACLIAFLLGVDLVAAIMAFTQGLYTREVGIWVLALVLPMLAGIILGNRRFLRTDPERFRRFVLLLLAALSFAVLLRALLG